MFINMLTNTTHMPPVVHTFLTVLANTLSPEKQTGCLQCCCCIPPALGTAIHHRQSLFHPRGSSGAENWAGREQWGETQDGLPE